MSYAGPMRIRYEGAQSGCAPYISVARSLVAATMAAYQVRPGGVEAATNTKTFADGAWVRVSVFASAQPIVTISVQGGDPSGAVERTRPDCHTGLAITSSPLTIGVIGFDHDVFLRVDGRVQTNQANIITTDANGNVTYRVVELPDKWSAPKALPRGTELGTFYSQPSGPEAYTALHRLACTTNKINNTVVYGGFADNCGRFEGFETYYPIVGGASNEVILYYVHTNIRELLVGNREFSQLQFWVSPSKLATLEDSTADNVSLDQGVWYISGVAPSGKEIVIQRIEGSAGAERAVYSVTLGEEVTTSELEVVTQELLYPNAAKVALTIGGGAAGLTISADKTEFVDDEPDEPEPDLVTTYVSSMSVLEGTDWSDLYALTFYYADYTTDMNGNRVTQFETNSAITSNLPQYHFTVSKAFSGQLNTSGDSRVIADSTYNINTLRDFQSISGPGTYEGTRVESDEYLTELSGLVSITFMGRVITVKRVAEGHLAYTSYNLWDSVGYDTTEEVTIRTSRIDELYIDGYMVHDFLMQDLISKPTPSFYESAFNVQWYSYASDLNYYIQRGYRAHSLYKVFYDLVILVHRSRLYIIVVTPNKLQLQEFRTPYITYGFFSEVAGVWRRVGNPGVSIASTVQSTQLYSDLYARHGDVYVYEMGY